MASHDQHTPVSTVSQASHLPPLLPKASFSESSPAAAGPLLTPRKRYLAAAACDKCRKRKIKCDERRPECTACKNTGHHCVYEFSQGLTSRKGKEESYRQSQQKIAQFKFVFDLLRSSSEAESAKTLEIIRNADTIEEGVSIAAGAKILVAPGDEAANKSSSSRETKISSAPLYRPEVESLPASDTSASLCYGYVQSIKGSIDSAQGTEASIPRINDSAKPHGGPVEETLPSFREVALGLATRTDPRSKTDVNQ